ncbi:histone-like nucleoid-structuring protein Lsr2 [Streptomyces sp. NPDC048489]|uniref:Lsr2 family DNA-binding protein n=1 Tax=Streptomyces sp. NPDC048489 TaxID=3154504 RepID=UPI0034383511
MQRQRWFTTGPWDTDFQERKFLPQALELYHRERPRELKREADERARKEEWARISAESQAASERLWRHKERMRHIRKWGPENGFFVGTRGRIPGKVMKAYEEAFGSE